MKKVDLIFVVLNYMNEEDTVEFVESIKQNIDTKSYEILLVDNNSPDGSGQKLFDRYAVDEFVTVLPNSENKGNSEGWNYGIRYARENYKFEFLSLPDNDCLFIEKNFLQKTRDEFKKSGFAVMGPMILTPSGRCDDNPLYELPYTREAAEFDIKFHEKKIKQLRHGTYYIRRKLRTITKPLFPVFYKDKPSRRKRFPGSFLVRQENVVLHGCFFIFSPVFFEHFSQLDVRSFMYAEEDILFMHVISKGLKTVYNPEILAYHKGDASTKKANKTPVKTEIFRSEKSIEAIKGYLSLLDELGI